jgi:hypothetical protein
MRGRKGGAVDRPKHPSAYWITTLSMVAVASCVLSWLQIGSPTKYVVGDKIDTDEITIQVEPSA